MTEASEYTMFSYRRVVRKMVDRVYKNDIPALRKDLENLKNDFSGLGLKMDWKKLRIEPLLHHARFLERVLRSEKFSQEAARLTRGVEMFHSDLVYLRGNLKGLKRILESAKKAPQKRRRLNDG